MAAYNTVTVTNSATKILAQFNPGSRKTGIIMNTSSGTVYVGFDNSVTTSNGIPILQYSTWRTNEPYCYQGDVYGIVASSTSDVRYEELK